MTRLTSSSSTGAGAIENTGYPSLATTQGFVFNLKAEAIDEKFVLNSFGISTRSSTTQLLLIIFFKFRFCLEFTSFQIINHFQTV